jgi:hypothetical protein
MWKFGGCREAEPQLSQPPQNRVVRADFELLRCARKKRGGGKVGGSGLRVQRRRARSKAEEQRDEQTYAQKSNDTFSNSPTFLVP